METRRLPIDPRTPDAETLRAAAESIRAGGLTAFPTETVYGLGANALDPAAVARIFAAKGRPATNPLIVHVLDAEQARGLCAAWPAAAERLTATFWPGPLSLILPKAGHVPDIVTAGGPTIAVRAPSHPVARGLIAAAGTPIAAPSANRSNYVSPTVAEHVLLGLDGRIETLLDGGPCAGGLESTVLDLSREPFRVLRFGPIVPAELQAALAELDVAVVFPHVRPAPEPEPGEVLRSPGQLPRHYAPRARLEWLETGTAADFVERVERRLADGATVAVLELVPPPNGDSAAHLPSPWDTHPGKLAGKLVRVRLPADAAELSALWYRTLYELDLRRVDAILVPPLPQDEPWLALRDRIRRGSRE